MSLRARLALVLLLAALTPAPSAAAETYLSEAEALKVAIPEAERVEKKWGTFPPPVVAALAAMPGSPRPPAVYDYFVGYRGKDVVGYARIDERIGKTLPITFVVGVGVGMDVRVVEIMAYRESHGGEVRQADFRGQFVGKRAADTLRVGQDVRNIAGATLSCRAIADGVRQNLAFLTVLVGAAAPGSAPNPAPAPPPAAPAPAAAPKRSGAAAPGPLFKRNRILMGTALEIQLHAPSRAAADAAFDAAFARVDALDRLLSSYRADSEISRLARATIGAEPALSPDTAGVLDASARLAQRTGGAFDIAVAPLARLWRDSLRQAGAPPPPAAVAAARQRMLAASRHLAAGQTPGGTELDLGAIGKGYALDAAAATLRAHGIDAALLNFGGQLLAVGRAPGRAGWPVAVTGDGRTVAATLELTDASVATSADDQLGHQAGGRRYSHIIDPRTGRPVEGMRSATVIAASATDADALSTALFVLGARDGAALARRESIAALLAPAKGDAVASPTFRSQTAAPRAGRS